MTTPLLDHGSSFALFNEPKPPANLDVFRAEQAEAIRVLGKRVTADIVEIGQRLIAVRKTCGHGEWQPWLDKEFGWKESTAYNYIAVAERFTGKLPTVGTLSIDAGALYLLSGPTVPDAARHDAIEAAETGERITKKRAGELIEEARHKALEEAAVKYRAELKQYVDEAVQLATTGLQEDRNALVAKIQQIHNDAANLPGIGAAICHMLGQKTLTPDQCQNLAEIMHTSISFNGRTYGPLSREQQAKVEENLKIASAITRALEALAGAPSANAFFDTAWPVQRSQHRRVIRTIIAWLNDYADMLDREET